MDDDVMYYRWIANDGPAKMTAEHKALALDSMSRFAADGIAVLAWRMHRSAFEEVAKVEVVIDCDGEIHTLCWNSFNKGWMVDTGHGWIIAAFVGRQYSAPQAFPDITF